MREIRPSGSEGGGGHPASPYPYLPPPPLSPRIALVSDTPAIFWHRSAVPFIGSRVFTAASRS